MLARFKANFPGNVHFLSFGLFEKYVIFRKSVRTESFQINTACFSKLTF